MSSRSRRALLVAGGFVAAASCALGTWWVLPSSEPTLSRVRVTIALDGESAEQIDRTIALPLAAAMSELEGSVVTTTSSAGRAEVMVELPADGMATVRVRDRVAAMTLSEAAYPQVSDAPRGRTLRWFLRGRDAADRGSMLAARLERSTRREVVRCAREEEVHVVVDTQRAAAYGTGPAEVGDALRRENVELPGGAIVQRQEEWAIRTHGELDSVESIGEVVIAIRAAVPVRVRDVASVAWSATPSGCACFVGGEPCASGSTVVLDEAGARASLHEEAAQSSESITLVDAALLFSAPAGTTREQLHRLGEALAGVAAVAGVREVAVELSPEEERADLAVLLVFDRGADASAVLREVEASVARVPGVLLHPPEGSAEVEIAGDELDRLLDTAGSVQRALGEVARVVSFGGDRAPELRVEIDRERAARLGVTEAELTRAVRLAAGGEIVTHFRDGEREHAVRVRTEDALQDLSVTTATGAVPLHQVATLTQELVVPVLYRCGTQRCVHLAIAADPDALEQARERLASIELPVGVTLRWRDPL